MKPQIITLSERDDLYAFAADWLAEVSDEIIAKSGRFTIALSGGSTPAGWYDHLVLRDEIKWSYFDFFWSDERFVPIDHQESNAGLAVRRLLQPLGIEKEHYFPVPTQYPTAHQAAMEYESLIRGFFGVLETVPRFDLILLGLGSDGHTASLFPNGKALLENRRLVTADFVEKLSSWRITFTLPLLNQAKNIAFIISGEEKAETVRRLLKEQDPTLPALQVRPTNGRLFFLLDVAAASRL
ncbi:MAG: 6-phosphogluconolactonase [candidate division KSB1 bacterium]|nr:6-phosphogluconolactonase [candidate division KSB1 bacterium]MDZ7346908.1 6-phosphogluconolactonase [candidate division KSB1 bacterium]